MSAMAKRYASGSLDPALNPRLCGDAHNIPHFNFTFARHHSDNGNNRHEFQLTPIQGVVLPGWRIGNVFRRPKEWIDKLGSPGFGANLDIGHSQVIGESIPDAVKLLGDRIWNLHVEDIPGRKHYHMIPGEGTLDWPALRTALVETKYDRFLTVELYTHTADPQSAARKGHQWLTNFFNAKS
jgi:hydroxypyruvate isomerase